MSENVISMKDVFISYSRKDTAIADLVCHAFDEAGITYFIDRQGIAGAMEFPEVLAKAILDCKMFLLLASKNSFESRFTNSEIVFAFNKKPKNCLLPYRIDNTPLPLALEFTFAGINWRDISQHPIDTVLVDDILSILGKTRKPKPAPEPSPSPSPTPKPAPAPTPEPAPSPAPKLTQSPAPAPAPAPAPEPEPEPEVDLNEIAKQAAKLYNSKQYEKALPLHEQLVAAGRISEAFWQGCCLLYMDKPKTDDDINHILELWEKASTDKFFWVRPTYYLGRVYISSYDYYDYKFNFSKWKYQDLKKGIDYLNRVIEEASGGDIYYKNEALYELGCLYTDHKERFNNKINGVPIYDPQKGINLLKQAFDSQMACSKPNPDRALLSKLAYIYYDGVIVPKDYAAAANYFEKLCEFGDDKSHLHMLISIYERGGNGVKADLDKARKYAEQMLDMGTNLYDQEAAALTVLNAKRGEYKKADKAFSYIYITRESKYPRACYYMGLIYLCGKLGAPDYAKARHYFELGLADDEHGVNHYMLAKMYEERKIKGLFIKNDKKAAELMAIAQERHYEKENELTCL